MPRQCSCPPAGTGKRRSKRASILTKLDKSTKVNVQAGFGWMVDALDQIAHERQVEKVAKAKIWPRIGEAVLVGSGPHGTWQSFRIRFRGGEPEYTVINYGSREDAVFFGAAVNEDRRLDALEKEAMDAEVQRLVNTGGYASARSRRCP